MRDVTRSGISSEYLTRLKWMILVLIIGVIVMEAVFGWFGVGERIVRALSPTIAGTITVTDVTQTSTAGTQEIEVDFTFSNEGRKEQSFDFVAVAPRDTGVIEAFLGRRSADVIYLDSGVTLGPEDEYSGTVTGDLESEVTCRVVIRATMDCSEEPAGSFLPVVGRCSTGPTEFIPVLGSRASDLVDQKTIDLSEREGIGNPAATSC